MVVLGILIGLDIILTFFILCGICACYVRMERIQTLMKSLHLIYGKEIHED